MQKTRNLIFITILAFTMVFFVSVAQAVSDTSAGEHSETILRYTFEQTNLGVDYIQDMSGNGHTGQGVNIQYDDGFSGDGLRFDREQARYVKVADSDDFDLEAFSIEADVKFNLPEESWPYGYQAIVAKEYQYILRAGHGNGEGHFNEGFLSAILFTQQGIVAVNLWEDEFKFEPSQWYNINFTYDKEYLKVFVDGDLIDKKYVPIEQNAPAYSSTPLYVGNHRSGSYGNPGMFDEFIGVIDNVKISSIEGESSVVEEEPENEENTGIQEEVEENTGIQEDPKEAEEPYLGVEEVVEETNENEGIESNVKNVMEPTESDLSGVGGLGTKVPSDDNLGVQEEVLNRGGEGGRGGRAPNITNKSVKINTALTNQLKGRILLQVENNGKSWYVKPSDGKRVYMKDGKTAYNLMRNESLGITNADLNKIPIGTIEKFRGNLSNDDLSKKLKEDKSFANRVQGRILLQVESRGEAWYVNPLDNKRYYMKDGDAAYKLMKFLSLGITNADLEEIAED